MKRFKDNKKGDIPVTILVIGVIGLCFLTIFSFWTANNNVDNAFLGIGLIETMNSIDEELQFYKETNFEGDYENIRLINFGNVEIITNEVRVVEGTYTKTFSCNVNWYEFFKTCKKEMVRIVK